MNSLKLRLFLSFVLIAISGCTTMEKLKFWGEEEEIAQPAVLKSFNQKIKIRTLWKKSLGSGDGYGINIPVISGDSIYLASSEGSISSFSLETGKNNWSKSTDDYISGSTGFGYKTIFYGTLDGQVVALEEKNGSEIWRVQLSSEVLAPPVTDGALVVVQTADGKISALDLKNGELKWVFISKVPRLSLRGTSTPLLSRGVVFAGFANGKAAMISSESGSPRWELPIIINEGKSELERIVDIDGKAILDGNMYVVASYQGNIASINISSGRPIWKEKFSTIRDLAKARSTIVGVNNESIVIGFGQSTGVTLWKQEGLKLRKLSSPVNLRGRIAVGDFEGFIHFLEAKSGSFIGRVKISNKPIDEIVTFSNKLLVRDKSGRLVLLSVD